MSQQVKGFQQKTTGEGNFFAIKFGSIVRESKTPQEGFEKITGENRRTHEPYTKYIQRYDTIEALITKIQWYDTEQKFTARYQGFKLHLDANGKKGVLDLAINARTTSRFMKLAENIDYAKPVEFRAWHDSKSDSTALFVGQSGSSVPQRYTAEVPLDMPPPTQSSSTGKWNYEAQMDFLHKRMVEVVIPKVQAVHGASNGNNGHQEQEAEPTEAAKTEKPLEQILKDIQTSLKDFSEEKDVSLKEAMEQWFGTKKWAEVEQMDPGFLKTTLKKLDDELTPF